MPSAGLGGLFQGFGHGVFLLFDRFDHLCLHAKAFEVVVRAVNLEIGIAVEMIGKEAHPNGERYQFS